MYYKIEEEKEEQVIDMYLNGYSMNDIAKQFNVSTTPIRRILLKNNINIRNMSDSHKKYDINENYFDIIDTEEKAYWLGFIFADGYNNENDRAVQIILQSRDDYFLNKLNKIIYKNRSLKYETCQGYSRCCLYIYNKHISEQLSLLGIKQRKTYGVLFPEWLDKNLYRHFIRGYFDGDGSVHTWINRNNGYSETKATFSIIGDINFINTIQDILVENCVINKTKLIHKEGVIDSVVSLCYSGGRQIMRIRDWLYKDATIFLERKHNIMYSLVTYSKV